MIKNVGTIDRWARALAAVGLAAAAFLAPWPLELRLAVLGLGAVYMLYTALAGSCLGYRLMGKSTCPLTQPH
jgi:hypothetical protein